MTPYEVFFFSSGAVEEHWTRSDLLVNWSNVYIGFPLGGLLSLALMPAAAVTLEPRQMARRVFDAALELLDRQIIDAEGLMAGNVDDVELTLPEGWPEQGGDQLPTVTALLSGPGVMAERFGGRIGRGWAELHRRLHPGPREQGRIPIGRVVEIGSSVRVDLPRQALASHRFEAWFRDHVVAKIPGAGHAPE